MSKKQSKIKTVKKVAKSLKAKPVIKKSGKLKITRAGKAKIIKKAVSPETAKKAVIKKAEKSIVKKNKVIKKETKPAKKIAEKKAKTVAVSSEKQKNAKSVKPVNKAIAEKKGADKPKKESKSTLKPGKAAKVTVDKKPSKPVKKEKEEKVKKAPKEIFDDLEIFPDDDFKEKKSRSRKKGGRKRKNKDDEDEPEIVHDELVEQLIRSTKKLRSQPKVPKILKTFTNPMASLTVALPPGDKKPSAPKKEPKGKFQVEYVIRTSAPILYEFITTPSGLSEWFADDVNIHDGIFTFFWDGSEQKARLLGFKDEKYVRMQWLDKPEGSYFEFKIEKDELTSDVSLIITDFADEASDLETSKRLWDTQIDKLLHVIGSY